MILAGGRGTRFAEETWIRPKPMIEVGGKPLLWHIMSIYAAHGFREFLVACGYKGGMIHDYVRRSPDARGPAAAPWTVEGVDTGLDTQTGGRILRLKDRIGHAPFMVTYGDGVGNVDLGALVAFHQAHGKLATVTAVRPPSRFGALTLAGDEVVEFTEKPQVGEGWINGGFFVFEPGMLDYLSDDTTILEHQPLEQLAAARQLHAFQHTGFWQPVDTLREKQILQDLWTSGRAPWKTW